MNETPLEKSRQACRKVVLEKQRRGYVAHATVYGGQRLLNSSKHADRSPGQLIRFPLAAKGLGLALRYDGMRSVTRRLKEDEIS